MIALRLMPVLLLALMLLPLPRDAARAMELKHIRLNDGTPALYATGEIGPGDAEALRAALDEVSKDRFGARVVRLNSPGGSVFHAMQMAQVFDEMRVMAVVAWDDLCASACAAILFIAADARLLLGNGRLMFHGCEPGNTTSELSRLMCTGDIGRFAGEQGFSPDWLFMGLQGAEERDTELYVNLRSIGCMGLQQPPGLAHYGARQTPCLQLAMTGAVSWDRDWRRPPGAPPLREQLPPGADRLAYLFQWSPPDSWSYRIERDAIGLGFRRKGQFPDGPELTLFCHYRLPGGLLLHLRQLAPAPIPVPRRAHVSLGGLSETVPVQHAWREKNVVIPSIRLDAGFHKRLETDAQAVLSVTLLDADGRPGATVAAPWGTGYIRQNFAWNHCGGRYPGEP